MKFNCGPTREEKREAKERWNKWFAWHPVRITSGDCRWLEYVERKGSYWHTTTAHGWDYKHRKINDA